MSRQRAVIIGSGFGGLALGIRLQSLGFETTICEKLDKPGGRAYVLEKAGFVWDMGPTVLTVPHFLEELFALERGGHGLTAPDFPAHVRKAERVREGSSAGPATARYVDIVPIVPFYRIYFDDGSYFDYDGDPESTRRQIAAIEQADLPGYERFHADAKAIFERGFLELGYTHFGDVTTMLKVVPDLLRLDAIRNLFRFTSKYFQSPKLRQVFSFETLLVGGNPLKVPAIYAMIHFVEKTWGIHFAMGGTGALVQALVRKFEELGGTLRCDAEVDRILVNQGPGGAVGRVFGPRSASGVRLQGGEELSAELVASNGDVAHTYMKLIAPNARRWMPDWRLKAMKYSMSLVVLYFGFKDDGAPLDLRHHNIILGPRYEPLLKEIFDDLTLPEDFSQYLHIPTLTDPTLAPPGHHAAYTLIPVPHNGSGVDWAVQGPRLRDAVLGFLEERGYIPNLRARLVHCEMIDPAYFEGTLNSYLGNAFGPEPVLYQSAYFRPHNRCPDLAGMYLVGAGTQPGAGTPSVLMSAKMTARVIAEDFGLLPVPSARGAAARISRLLRR